jgi:hypothetical protein
MPNFRPVWILAHGERGKNAQVFATRKEAHDIPDWPSAAMFLCASWNWNPTHRPQPTDYTYRVERGAVFFCLFLIDKFKTSYIIADIGRSPCRTIRETGENHAFDDFDL